MGKVRAFFNTSNRRHWASILTMLALSVASVNVFGGNPNYLASVTSTVQQEPFDGTVMPIQRVPDWSNLASGENKLSYSAFPANKLTDIPVYDNEVLKKATQNLGWTEADKKIRNAQITYPVPYAGNYELNACGEGCGSHPAVDIKALLGTPVYAIANGVIEDAGTSSSWGNYVVIRHSGVPSPDSPSQTTTLFSVYSHLDQLFVSEGKAIRKGAVLGEVGDTGTATTYHLHFQLDNVGAPWHPYWPFTTAEASAAGYGFWDAVNYGVGQDKLYAYTENPFDFVQAHLDEDAALGELPSEEVVSEEDPEEPEAVETPETNSDQSSEESDVEAVHEDFASIGIEVPEFVNVGEQETVYFYLLDGDGNRVKENVHLDEDIPVFVSDSSLGSLNNFELDRDSFEEGQAELRFYGDHPGTVNISLNINGQTFTSLSFDIVSEASSFDHFDLVHDGNFVPRKAEAIQLQALDELGNFVNSFEDYGTIELSIVQGSGTLDPASLTREDFKNGLAEFTFVGDSDEPVIFRFSYGLVRGESQTLRSELFDDFETGDTYFDAVNYLYRKGTVQGYPDGTFQPEKTVSRVEALKFIFSGLDQPINSRLSASYKDTRMGEWYSPFLATASSLGVVQGYPDGTFKPTQGVNRVEFLKMLFSTVDVGVDPVVTEDPYRDVNNLSWYAPYVQYAKEKNIFPISGSAFNPSAPMSRVEVAEVIYRLITVLDNQEEAYSVLQKPSDY